MPLPISALMTRTVATVSTEDSILQVEAALDESHLHAIPVVDAKGELFGILSGVDLVHFHASKKNPAAVRAWEICTYRPYCVAPETPADQVAKAMIDRRIHHVLVKEGERLVGIVSSFDFVERFLREAAKK